MGILKEKPLMIFSMLPPTKSPVLRPWMTKGQKFNSCQKSQPLHSIKPYYVQSGMLISWSCHFCHHAPTPSKPSPVIHGLNHLKNNQILIHFKHRHSINGKCPISFVAFYISSFLQYHSQKKFWLIISAHSTAKEKNPFISNPLFGEQLLCTILSLRFHSHLSLIISLSKCN